MKTCAQLLEDTELLAKLSVGDMVSLEAKYHTKCLVGLYNRARRAKAKSGLKSTGEEDIMSRIAFAELVMYIEETRYSDEDQAPVFKLSDLAQLYVSRMEQLGVKVDTRVHTTRLKQRLLAQFTNMKAQKKGRDVLMAFEALHWPKHVSLTVITRPFTLPVQQKLYVVTFLGRQNLLLGSQQGVKKNLCHPYCLL